MSQLGGKRTVDSRWSLESYGEVVGRRDVSGDWCQQLLRQRASGTHGQLQRRAARQSVAQYWIWSFFHSTEVDESFCRWISASSIPIKIPKNWGHSVERAISYSRFVRSSTLNDHSKWNAMIVIQGLLSAGKWNNIEGDSGCTSGWNG